MANVFDQFDEAAQATGNVFDQFDNVEPETSGQEAGPASLTEAEYFQLFGDAPDIDGLIKPEVKEEKEELSIGESLEGVGETALAAVTGSTFGMAGSLVGTLQGIAEEMRSGKFGTNEAANRIEKKASEFAESLTNTPESKAGKEFTKVLGEAGEALAPLAGLAAPLQQVSQLGRATVASKGMTGRAPAPSKPPTLKNTGIRATTGEANQDLPSQKAEQFLLEQSSEGGGALRAYKLEQSRELKSYLEDLAPDQVDNIGGDVKQALELRDSDLRSSRSAAYKKLGEVTKDLDVRLNTNVISDSLPSKRELRNFERTSPNQFSAIDGLLNEFGFDLTDEGVKKAAKGGYEIEPLSVANMEEFRKALGAIEKSDQSGATSVITGPLKNALDSEFNLASKSLQESGQPSVAQAAKEARQTHIALKTEFDEKGLTRQLIDNKSYQSRLPKLEESQVYNKLLAKSTPIESFNKVVESLDASSAKGARAKSQIKSQMIMDLLDSGFSAKSRKINGEQVFGANAFATRFDNIEPKLKSIMSTSEFKKLRALRDDAKDLTPPSGALPKGSSGFFIEALEKAGMMGLLNSIPYAGAASASFLKKIGSASLDAKAFERAVKSSKEVKDTVNLLSNDYPALAAALGIAAINEKEEE
jgi:hypothetical protein